MSTEAAVLPIKVVQDWKSPSQIKARIMAIKQLMDSTLKQDVDYGIIPGMGKGTKPSLWKPGSEQILAMFQIAVRPIVEDLSSEDCMRYRVTCELTHAVTGEFLGAGIGEASTDESKYKWRRTYAQKEFDATPEDRRRIKYGQRYENGGWKDYEEMQVRQEPADLANTVLKIAKKRAQIDATLTVTGASSMFSQDLEDLPDEVQQQITRQPQPRSKKSAANRTEDVVCADCGAVNAHYPGCKYMTEESPNKPPPTKSDKKAELTPYVIRVDAVDPRRKETPDPKNPKKVIVKEFLVITGIDSHNKPATLYCWHTGVTWQRITAIPPKTNCIFMVKTGEYQGQTYHNIDQIVEITGEVLPSEQQELVPPQ